MVKLRELPIHQAHLIPS